jgi:hypothetical protein
LTLFMSPSISMMSVILLANNDKAGGLGESLARLFCLYL